MTVHSVGAGNEAVLSRLTQSIGFSVDSERVLVGLARLSTSDCLSMLWAQYFDGRLGICRSGNDGPLAHRDGEGVAFV